MMKTSLYEILNKIDIHEEITRFNNHIEQFNNHIHSVEMEKGKRFDFILQELGREINTITAKCSDANISNHAINIKVEVEKIREQIQNIPLVTGAFTFLYASLFFIWSTRTNTAFGTVPA